MPTLNGAELGPLFVPPHAARWFWIVALLPLVPAVALSLYGLVRGRFPGGSALGGGVAAAAWLLPLFAYLLGGIDLTEEAKGVAFCGSCHEPMSPLVESLASDEESLAAIHYQRGAVSREEACYTCHSGYGIWGTVAAKRAGLGHMLRTIAGDYSFPLQHDGPYDIDACQNCHAATLAFREVEEHRDPDLARAMVDREIGCTGDCHPSAHPDSALVGATAALHAARPATTPGANARRAAKEPEAAGEAPEPETPSEEDSE